MRRPAVRIIWGRLSTFSGRKIEAGRWRVGERKEHYLKESRCSSNSKKNKKRTESERNAAQTRAEEW
jgi:hypothetical protein